MTLSELLFNIEIQGNIRIKIYDETEDYYKTDLHFYNIYEIPNEFTSMNVSYLYTGSDELVIELY